MSGGSATREGQGEDEGEDDVETRERARQVDDWGDGTARDKNYDDVENMDCDWKRGRILMA